MFKELCFYRMINLVFGMKTTVEAHLLDIQNQLVATGRGYQTMLKPL